MLAVVIAVNLMTPMQYQRTDLGYSFIADFSYQLIHELLNFATGMAVGLHLGRLIHLYIEYMSRS